MGGVGGRLLGLNPNACGEEEAERDGNGRTA
jgi:hypothetical protein